MHKLLAPDGKHPQQLIPVELIGGWVMLQLVICECESHDWVAASGKANVPVASEMLLSRRESLLILALEATDIAPPTRPKIIRTTTSL